MKKNFFLKIENINSNYEGKLPLIIQNEKGEYECYNNFIKQKKSNKKELKITTYFNKQFKEFQYSNFGYNSDGNILVFIYEKQYLVVFDKLINSIKYFTGLPEKLIKNIDDYSSGEKRGFFKKIFSRIGFNDIVNNSNNIFISDSGNNVLIAANDRKSFYYFYIKNAAPAWLSFNLDELLINLSESIVLSERQKLDIIERIKSRCENLKEDYADELIKESKNSTNKNLIILQFIKNQIENKIDLDFKKNFFVEFIFHRQPNPISYSNQFKENNSNKPKESYNNFIKSQFSGLNLSNYTAENYKNLFHNFLEKNFNNNFSSQYNIDETNNPNSLNNRSSYQFPYKLLNKLNHVLLNEYLKNNSSILAYSDLGKSNDKRNSNFGSFSQIYNFSSNTHGAMYVNNNIPNNLRNLSNLSSNVEIAKKPNSNDEKETLEISFCFLIFANNEKTNINDYYILNLIAFIHVDKENLFHLDFSLIKNKNFSLSEKIKIDNCNSNYILEINKSSLHYPVDWNVYYSENLKRLLEERIIEKEIKGNILNKRSKSAITNKQIIKNKNFSDRKRKLSHFDLEIKDELYLNFIVKKVKSYEEYIIHAINYSIHYFEILIYSLRFKLIKRFNSDQICSRSTKLMKNIDNIFIRKNFLLILFSKNKLSMIDLDNIELAQFSHDNNKISFYLDIDYIFNYSESGQQKFQEKDFDIENQNQEINPKKSKIKILNILLESKESVNSYPFQNIIDNHIPSFPDKNASSELSNEENETEINIFFLLKKSVKFLSLKKIHFYSPLSDDNDNNIMKLSIHNSLSLQKNNSLSSNELNKVNLFKEPDTNKIINKKSFVNEYKKKNYFKENVITSYKTDNQLNINFLIKLFYTKEFIVNFYKENKINFSYDFLDELGKNSILKVKKLLQEEKCNDETDIMKGFELSNIKYFDYIKILINRLNNCQLADLSLLIKYDSKISYQNYLKINDDYMESHLNYSSEDSLCDINNLNSTYRYYNEKAVNNYDHKENSNNLSNGLKEKSVLELDEQIISNEDKILIKNIYAFQSKINFIYKECSENFDFFTKDISFVIKKLDKYVLSSIKNNALLTNILLSDKDNNYSNSNLLIRKYYQYLYILSEKIRSVKSKENKQETNNIDFIDLFLYGKYMESSQGLMDFSKLLVYTSKPQYFYSDYRNNGFILNFIQIKKLKISNNFCSMFEKNKQLKESRIHLPNLSFDDFNVQKLQNILYMIKDDMNNNNNNLMNNGKYSEIFLYKEMLNVEKLFLTFKHKKIDFVNPIVKQNIARNLFYLINKRNNYINYGKVNNKIEKRFSFLYELNFKMKLLSNCKSFYIYLIKQLLKIREKVENNENVINKINLQNIKILQFNKINIFLNCYFTNSEKKEILITTKEMIYELFSVIIIKDLKFILREKLLLNKHLDKKIKNKKTLNSDNETSLNIIKGVVNNINIDNEISESYKESAYSDPLNKINVEKKDYGNILFDIISRKIPYSFFNIFEKVNFLKRIFINIYTNNIDTTIAGIKNKYLNDEYASLIKFSLFVFGNIISNHNFINLKENKKFFYVATNEFILRDLYSNKFDLVLCDLVNVIENPGKRKEFILSYLSNIPKNNKLRKLLQNYTVNSQMLVYIFAAEKLGLFDYFLNSNNSEKSKGLVKLQLSEAYLFKTRSHFDFMKIIMKTIIFDNNQLLNLDIFNLLIDTSKFRFNENNKEPNSFDDIQVKEFEEKVKLFMLLNQFLNESYLETESNDTAINIINSLNLNASNEIKKGKKYLQNIIHNFFKCLLNLMHEIVNHKCFYLDWFWISLFNRIKFNNSQFTKFYRNYIYDTLLIILKNEFSNHVKKLNNLFVNKQNNCAFNKIDCKDTMINLFLIGKPFRNIIYGKDHIKTYANQENIADRFEHFNNNKNNSKDYLYIEYYKSNNFELAKLLEKFVEFILCFNFQLLESKQNKHKLGDYESNLFNIFENNAKMFFKINHLQKSKKTKNFYYLEKNHEIKTDLNNIGINEGFQLLCNLINLIKLFLSKNKEKAFIEDLLLNANKQRKLFEKAEKKKFTNFIKRLNFVSFSIFSYLSNIRLILLNLKLNFLCSYLNEINIKNNKSNFIKNESSIKDTIKKEIEIINVKMIEISIFNFFEDLLINPDKQPIMLDDILNSIVNQLDSGNFNNNIIESFFLFLNFDDEISIQKQIFNEDVVTIKKTIFSKNYYDKILQIKNLIRSKSPIYFERNNKRSNCLKKLLEERIFKDIEMQTCYEKLHFILTENYEEYGNFYQKLIQTLFNNEKNKQTAKVNDNENTINHRIKAYKKNIKKEYSELNTKMEQIFSFSTFFKIEKKNYVESFLNITKAKKNFVLNILSNHSSLRYCTDIKETYSFNLKDKDYIQFLSENIYFSEDSKSNLIHNKKIKSANNVNLNINQSKNTQTVNPQIYIEEDDKLIKIREINNKLNEDLKNHFEKDNKSLIYLNELNQDIETYPFFIDYDNDDKDNKSEKLDNSLFFRYLSPKIKLGQSYKINQEAEEEIMSFRSKNTDNSKLLNSETSIELEKIIKKKYIATKIIVFIINKIIIKKGFKQLHKYFCIVNENNSNASKNLKMTNNLLIANKKQALDLPNENKINLKTSNINENCSLNNILQKNNLNNQTSFFSKNENLRNFINSNNFNSNESSIINENEIKYNTVCNTVNMTIYNNLDKSQDEVDCQIFKKQKKLNKKDDNQSLLNDQKYKLIGKSLYPKLMNNIHKFK